jgi:hypothetical protein
LIIDTGYLILDTGKIKLLNEKQEYLALHLMFWRICCGSPPLEKGVAKRGIFLSIKNVK